MVTYISWKEAQARAHEETVIFAEVMSRGPEGLKLEIHVMAPTGSGLHELERDDTGRMSGEGVDAAIGRIAAEHGVRYAAIRRSEDRWPPDWALAPRAASAPDRGMSEETRRKIRELLESHRTMTLATLRSDGWPQATTVGYVHDGLTLYFFCAPDSQMAANIDRDDRVSLTIGHDAAQVTEITGLSMAARVRAVEDPAEVEKIMRPLLSRYPPRQGAASAAPKPSEVRVFGVVPTAISVLDYSRGFGHTELVAL